MDSLYPNLHERFKSEGLCPICLMEMELAPRYTCDNQHTICYRCKPYYYNCPTCHSPLEMEMPAAHHASYSPPPPTHFLPHPVPPKFQPSAPPSTTDFHEREKSRFPPPPVEDQELKTCQYSHLGCWVKVPVYLADLHESRCQFRPHLEEEYLPTDLVHKHDDLVECRYQGVGCKVRMPPWRTSIHEDHCIYKDSFNSMEFVDPMKRPTIPSEDYETPEDLVECKYRKYGCMVNMPRRRKLLHQEKCNYRNYGQENDEDDDSSSSEGEYDPNEQIPCKWAEHGCRVRPKRSRLGIHEEKCNYRMEECAYKHNGCPAVFQPSRKFAHERTCEYAN